MTCKQITEYLELAKDAEIAVYKQETVINTATSALKKTVVEKGQAVLPTRTIVNEPKEEPWIVAAIFGVVLIILGLVTMFTVDDSGAWGVILGALFIIPAILIFRACAKSKKKYAEDMDKYWKKEDAAREKFNTQMKAYNDRIKSNENFFKINSQKAEESYQAAKRQISLLSEPLQNAKNNLATIYSKDYIYPKYRNMIAMCAIYEYFITGRVSELEGPNGAYNLYETELRQNMIINKLDTVISQLEQIKENQYTLYTAMKEQQITLQSIKNNISNICANTDKLAACSAITAYCAQVTSINSGISARCNFLNTL